ncbi:putative disease resistance RPP13-like protein 2 [Eucalyptus grandis]|uniref:putative disease resistance RPP13-like protein 2 n=1 Tax=Eucalyptus grandis TaxID=71139 RepID=UPI00192E9591|nr:putative disease resistance RPP13-like protein 2 [Eucalyptus grandis]
MTRAAPGVAVSLAIARLHDLLHWYKDVIVYPNLTDQISDSISNLQWILNTRMNAELSDDCRQSLRILADKAKEMEECLVEWFGDQTPKLQKGCVAKVFASVRLFSVTNRARHWEGMAKDFMTRVLVDRLTDGESNLRVISVVGKQHCGKTAVVRSVFNMPKIKQHFDRRLASCHVPRGGVLLEAEPPGGHTEADSGPRSAKDLEHKDEEQLCEMLHKSLMEQRYLIVLDNWGDAELFSELLIPFVDSKNGSRVIVTTHAEMHNYADPWTPDLHFLPDLTNKECEDLLHVSITGGGNSIDDDSQLKMTIKEEILSKCNGSPPAISLLGGLLSTVKVSNQASLIKQLKDRPTLEDIMRLSFDELPSIMKLCVLYMALYPEESEVPTRRLFRQWATEWLLAEAANGLERSLSAEDCFRQLERRNLICVVRQKPDGSAQSCRMPAFLHEFFRQKAKEFGLLRIKEETRVTGPNPKQSAQHQQVRGQTPAEGHYSCQVHCLRSFALFNTSKLETQGRDIVVLDASQNLLKPKLLDRRLYLLRVIDLEGVYKPVLPENFGNILSNLRYLGLRWTILDSIPESVGNLLLLETLDLKHTNITKKLGSLPPSLMELNLGFSLDLETPPPPPLNVKGFFYNLLHSRSPDILDDDHAFTIEGSSSNPFSRVVWTPQLEPSFPHPCPDSNPAATLPREFDLCAPLLPPTPPPPSMETSPESSDGIAAHGQLEFKSLFHYGPVDQRPYHDPVTEDRQVVPLLDLNDLGSLNERLGEEAGVSSDHQWGRERDDGRHDRRKRGGNGFAAAAVEAEDGEK